MQNRRTFIHNGSILTGSIALAGLASSFKTASVSGGQDRYTVQQVIDLVLREGGLKPIPNTVDTLKSGSPDAVVTGIVTTMFATTEVIEQTAKLGANFIIAHEPTFYNHTDSKDFVKDNSVVEEKTRLLDKHKITVWRCHDYIHSIKPDVIGYGFLKKSGWLQYYKAADRFTITIPPMPLGKMAAHLKQTLNIRHVRVIGDLQQPCSKITLIPGAAGGKMQMSIAVPDKPDVLVVGEVSEWETAEYTRDAVLQGRKTALIVLGHEASEDPGMEYFVEWLQPKLPGMKITHIRSGDPFQWL